MQAFLMRMYRAAKLDSSFWDQLVTRTDLHRQSIWVMAIYVMVSSMGIMGRGGGKAVNTYLVSALIAWYVWAFTAYYFGKQFIKITPPVDRQAVMRVMGYATAPGVVALLGALPGLAIPVWLLLSAWMIYAAAFGLQRVFSQVTLRPTIILCAISYLMATVVQIIFMAGFIYVFTD